jgi:hypothetical protein
MGINVNIINFSKKKSSIEIKKIKGKKKSDAARLEKSG